MRITLLICAISTSIISCKKENPDLSKTAKPIITEPIKVESTIEKPTIVKKKTVKPKTELQISEDLGKELFNGKGACVMCHQPDEELVGPSFKEIAKTYKEKKGDLHAFLKGDADPIVNPLEFEIMESNLEAIKDFSDVELKALEDYIYSNLN